MLRALGFIRVLGFIRALGGVKGFRVQGLRFRASGSGFRAYQVLGFQGLGVSGISM